MVIEKNSEQTEQNEPESALDSEGVILDELHAAEARHDERLNVLEDKIDARFNEIEQKIDLYSEEAKNERQRLVGTVAIFVVAATAIVSLAFIALKYLL